MDTQIVSKAFKGLPVQFADGGAISSIVANEFLLVQHRNPAKANFYMRRSRFSKGLQASVIAGDSSGALEILSSQRSADAIHVDFGGQYPAVVEFNSVSLSECINQGRARRFMNAVRILAPTTAKLLVRRFKFLVARNLRCVPINPADIRMGFQLLELFARNNTPKANFRNTWNDILILASSINRQATLLTEDTLLARFAATHFDGRMREKPDNFSISFGTGDRSARRRSHESKGYVNRSWRLLDSR